MIIDNNSPADKTATSGKRRPPKWTGETIKGQPLLRGLLIAPTKRQLRIGETYTIVIACPFCNYTHTHGWPGGPEKITPEHRASHCPGNTGGYYIVPEASVSMTQ